MSTSKVLKNAKPHQVQMREGSKDAQRKPLKAKTETAPVEKTTERKVKIEPVKPTKVSKPIKVAKPVAAPPPPVIVPASIAKKPRVKSKPATQDSPAPVDSIPKPTVTAPAPATAPAPRAPVPEHELWETDSAVMRRISLLRTRNAQLSEQVQRLKKPA